MNRRYDRVVQALGEGAYTYPGNTRPFDLIDTRTLNTRCTGLLRKLRAEIDNAGGRCYRSDETAEHDGVFVFNVHRKRRSVKREVARLAKSRRKVIARKLEGPVKKFEITTKRIS